MIKLNNVFFSSLNVPFNKNQNTQKKLNLKSNINKDIFVKSSKISKVPSFGRSMEEHLHYLGANYDNKTKKTTFRLWAQPTHVDFSKGMQLEVITPEVLEESPKLKAYLSNCKADMPSDLSDKVKTINMKISEKNPEIFEAETNIPAGSFYRYVFISSKDNDKTGIKKGDLVKQKDVRSYYLPEGLYGWSQVVDDSSYEFKYKKPEFKESEPNLIYEMHIGTFSKEGTFEAASRKLKSLADKGYTHIQVMPVWQAYGPNWGYDAVPWAISKDYCGKKGPDAFKAFVDEAHKNGLAVVVDVNYNHFSEGFAGYSFAQYFSTDTSILWGDSYNDKEAQVRNYVFDELIRFAKINNVDGFRIDSVHNMKNGFVNQLSLELASHTKNADLPKILLFGEDYSFYPSFIEPISQKDVQDYIESPEKFDYDKVDNTSSPKGFDAVINLDAQATVANTLMRDKNGYNAALASKVESLYKEGKRFEPYPVDKLIFTYSSHDDLNRTKGIRPIVKSLWSSLDFYNRVEQVKDLDKSKLDTDLFIKRKSVRILQKLLDEYEQSKNSSFPDELEQKKMGITQPVSKNEFENAYKIANNLNKTALALHIFAPGNFKMIFQGDDSGAKNRFRFFADKKNKNHIVNMNQNEFLFNTYHKVSFPKSQLEQDAYNNYDQNTIEFYDKLMNLFKTNPALKYRKTIERSISNDNKDSNVFEIGYKSPDNKHKVFAVFNLGDTDYPGLNTKEYGIQITKGKWKEVINSNPGEHNEYTNSEEFSSDGKITPWGNKKIKIKAHSVVIFEKID